MDKSHEQKRATAYLYPATEPFDRRMLEVGDGHSLYVEQCGNPQGVPVVVLHGGPGGGSSPMMRRFFDPAYYRVILFDQRGCGRSKPHASVEGNTTQHLINDIELIRETLGIERWLCFGGSWGATLALAYTQAYPERVAYLVLRGVFMGTQSELEWFYGGGAGRFYPEFWARFVDPIPEAERNDLIGAYHRRLFSDVFAEEARFAKLWSNWENALATVETRGQFDTPVDYARAFARLENHYFINNCFFEEDGQLMANLWRMKDVQGVIVQGQYDMICPPVTAWNLHRKWASNTLRMVPMAGHALSEPGITAELVRVMDGLRDRARRS
ncbi:prolyl aminopeptidase [Pararhodobacter oceanensis]|uniref:Proline iminopeptidase n=1 Tax=Pararhodobacter oceanensis TaxID=2172121 RepID=A0A2T8HSH1_9RHOB|nr:prolyl aminopeptidase [Pararhodobacter oceanensis]PVH28398.1 prolyl aminopeptidase [Pararhodobacter oceanensis]